MRKCVTYVISNRNFERKQPEKDVLKRITLSDGLHLEIWKKRQEKKAESHNFLFLFVIQYLPENLVKKCRKYVINCSCQVTEPNISDRDDTKFINCRLWLIYFLRIRKYCTEVQLRSEFAVFCRYRIRREKYKIIIVFGYIKNFE